MDNNKPRSTIDDKYKWDLTSIYKNINDFDKDYKKVLRLIKKFPKWETNMLESAINLKNCIDDQMIISRILDKLYSYASLKLCEDTSVNDNIELEEKVINLYNLFDVNSCFVKNNLLKMNYKDIKKLYKENKDLSKYDRLFKNIFRFKKHVLSFEEEKLLSNLSNSFGSMEKTYTTFTNSDLTFGTIEDEKNNTVVLTDSNYRKYLESKDRRVRHDAFKTLYKTYEQYKNTFATLIEGHVKENNAISKIRNYKSTLESCLYPDEVNIEVFNNLIDTVSDNLNVLFEYFKIKKDLLGYEEVHIYDLFTNIISNYNKEYSYKEACSLVKESLKVLGDDYSKNLERAFTEGWIDVYPNKGKRTGAFSGGCYDTKPYVLLNYLDNLNNVSTLAHELGHSMHSYYTRNNNDYIYGDYRIIIAEVASTVNELLLSRYMIEHSSNREEKLIILDNLMELFKATIFRQTMFSEFEKTIYEESSKGRILTSDYLCDLYYNLNKKYFSNDIVIDEEIKYEWERVPHFYYDFYVYKYATGLASACYIVERILNKDENAVKDYIKFLSLGSSLPPLEALKVAGVDLTKKEVIESAIKMFKQIIDEFKKEYDK